MNGKYTMKMQEILYQNLSATYNIGWIILKTKNLLSDMRIQWLCSLTRRECICLVWERYTEYRSMNL